MIDEQKISRCDWCDTDSSLYVAYHDNEWGIPLKDDKALFEMLILEGMQAGLSWLTILKKRQSFRKAFDNFDYFRVAQYDEAKKEELLQDSSIIRNRLKIGSTIQNAKVFIEIQKEYSSFARYLWGWVEGKPICNAFEKIQDLPAKTDLSTAISKDLKKRGMNFVGPTIIYAYMQAVGMVNDHEITCVKYDECCRLAEQFTI